MESPGTFHVQKLSHVLLHPWPQPRLPAPTGNIKGPKRQYRVGCFSLSVEDLIFTLPKDLPTLIHGWLSPVMDRAWPLHTGARSVPLALPGGYRTYKRCRAVPAVSLGVLFGKAVSARS